MVRGGDRYALARERLVGRRRAEGVSDFRCLEAGNAVVRHELVPEALRKSGARVDVVTVYRTVPAEGPPGVRREIMAGDIDVVTFTSWGAAAGSGPCRSTP